MPSAAGRPRDPRIDAAILRATTDLLVEIGYSNLTMAAVAERAGTTKTALYRRWSSKAELVHEAAFPAAPTAIETPPGNFRADVRAMIAAARECVHQPGGAGGPSRSDRRYDGRRRTEHAGDGPVHGCVRRRAVALGRRDAARRRASDIDPDRLIEVIGGATMLRLLLWPERELDDEWVDQTTAIVAHGVIA